MQNMAEAVGRAWHDLVADRAGRSDRQLREIADRFSRDALLPEQIRDRLTGTPIGGG